MENITTNPQEGVDISQQMETNVNPLTPSISPSVTYKEEKKEDKLNLRQEEFCQLFATETEFFGNGVQTYIEVYKPDKTEKNWYKNACSMASQILSNLKVCRRINELLEEGGLNDQNVDKQLQYLITQYADNTSKLGAIREYNKLKQRITEKLEHSGKIENIVTKEQITELLKRNETNA